jgi:hypothetical protein
MFFEGDPLVLEPTKAKHPCEFLQVCYTQTSTLFR